MGTVVEAVVFDWDGTAVADRSADAGGVRSRVEAMCAAGVHVTVVSGTHVGNVDGQLRARPAGRGRLHLCLNRGSEVFEVTSGGPVLVSRRRATAEEDGALDRAAHAVVEQLAARGVDSRLVSDRLNRRKVDVIPEPAWADPLKSRIGDLLHAVTARLRKAGLADLSDVVRLAEAAAKGAGLADPRVTSDVKHVEIGLTDKSDSARWAAAWLAARGITGSLVLIGGDEFGPIGGVPGSDSFMLVPELARAHVVSVGVEPGGVPRGVTHAGGGPPAFVGLLDGELGQRAGHRVPSVDVDPAWVVELPGDPARARAAESLGSLANGWAGTRGSREEVDGGRPAPLLVNGIYTDGNSDRLLPGPCWTGLDVRWAGTAGPCRRVVDLRTGVLARWGEHPSSLRSVRFVSAARPGALALRAEAAAAGLDPGRPLRPSGEAPLTEGQRGGVVLARAGTGEADGIAMAAADRLDGSEDRRVVERLAAWVPARAGEQAWDGAPEALAALEELGFDALLAEHREAWARLWEDAEVTIDGQPDDQLAARFCVFHVLSAAPAAGEAAVGPRGLTGDAYGGHVFWDADVFVLPALAAIRPAAARAVLEYRIRRLPAARAEAAALGRNGARFPWESGADGRDVTPAFVLGRRGERIPVRTAEHEEHVVADVAWAAHRYAAWTGDGAFLAGPGRDLLLDTARYWASRVRRDGDGRDHLDAVMGPDEYHAVVDDNAYTNIMARWNLRRAAELVVAAGGNGDEAAGWRDVAGRLVDGWDEGRGLYEQFAGYWELEPLLAAQVAPPPIAADLVLGVQRVAESQLIKQADVLMAHHLVPGELVPGSLGPCLAFYEPRTAHGSSLSPAIHASLLARAGQPERALELFRMAARLDFDDLTGTTAGGLHLATMGGVWQALADGFLGLRAGPGRLEVDPRLPDAWDALAMRFRFQGDPLGIRATHDHVTISCSSPLVVSVAGGPEVPAGPPGTTVAIGRADR
jgi:trehalose/maltose hydrolase-like predicted phosphorylase